MASTAASTGPDGVAEASPAEIVWTLKRKPTINDVARLAQVSKKTVSRVINKSPLVHEETRDRIDAIIKAIGYIPDPNARGLASQRSFLLGLVYDNPNAQFIISIQEGVLEASRRAGYELVVHPCNHRSPDLLEDVKHFVERQRLDGLIISPPVGENAELARLLTELECRYTRLAYVPLDEPSNVVVSHDWQTAAEVADLLAGMGHRRIGFIKGPSGYGSAHERARGFLGALEKHGITLPPELVVEGAYTFESGEAGAEKLLSLDPRPTAIFAGNDEMAAGVYKVAYRRGISIPRDLSVVGFDDGPIASRLSPSLTTVRLPIKEMGRMAAEKLIARLTDPGHVPEESTVVPRLIVRESCAPPQF
ncbi:MAG TPA: LacI family DNA-binding transcriptional regulator [Azospirillaceae bacterium]|nr:LacI family DNA-binding transcriptional regulator [Azospirillaceae bacterium]